MAEPATEQPVVEPEEVKVPVRDGDAWRCPDCGGPLKGQPAVDGLRCDDCSISWSVGFMTELLQAEQVPCQPDWVRHHGPVITQDEYHVTITDGKAIVVLSTELALILAARIQWLAAQGVIGLKE